MVKTIIVAALVCVISSMAGADEYHFITVESNSSDILASIQGFPGRYWGQAPVGAFLSGDDTSLAWLSGRGLRCEAVTFDQDVSVLYLCYFDNNDLPQTPIITSGRNYVVTITPAVSADALRRLTPMSMPSAGGVEVRPPMILTYDADINVLVNRVSRDSIISYLTMLSGRAPVEVGGEADTIHTRYSGTEDNALAAQFLKETLEGYGYQTEYHGFYSGNLRNVTTHDAGRAWAISEASDVMRTTDGGGTWTMLTDNVVTSLWGIENAGPDSVWFVGDAGVIRFSSNAGNSFVVQIPSVGGFFFGIDFVNNLEGWIVGDLGRVINTTNSGATWITQTTPVTSRLYDVCFVDNLYGWAVGRDGTIIQTTNGGTNWAEQTSNTAQRLYGVDFVDRDNGWAVGWGGVVRHTTNGGANWQSVDVGSLVEKYQVDFTDLTHGCIVGWAGEIFITTDGGADWIQVEAGFANDFYGVDFASSSTGYVVGQGMIAKTTDGGVTWHSQTAGIESSWRNIVATRPGTVSPGQQVMICAHMDNTSQQPIYNAPGADDNGSGAVAVIEAARIFSGIPFERTIKFALWTGEEQGLMGSAAYAADAAARSDTIYGVFNFDMIAWDGNGDGSIELHCGNMPASQDIGHLFEDVITDYNINLQPEFLTWNSTDRSDHASFWDQNYPAILGIEDFSSDFNPYYHTTNDNMDIIDTTMFVSFVKAAVGATASLALPDTELTGVGQDNRLPLDFSLAQNYPNPFNPSTRLSFNLPQAGQARLEIYDLLGRSVRTLIDGPLDAGYHSLNWDGRMTGSGYVSSGIYFARLQFGEMTTAIRMTLEK